jgi:hypothetical protein
MTQDEIFLDIIKLWEITDFFSRSALPCTIHGDGSAIAQKSG